MGQPEHTNEIVAGLIAGFSDDPEGFDLQAALSELRPADLAEVIDELEDDDRVAFFKRLPRDMRADTLIEVDEEAWPDLLQGLGGYDARALLTELERDDAADVLAELAPEDASRFLDQIAPDESREITALMEYDGESAGGVMTTDLVSVRSSLTADEAIASVRSQGRKTHDFFTVYVVDAVGKLVGRLALQDLILATGATSVQSIMETDVIRVGPEVDQEDVARLISKYNLVSIPVVDENDRLLGRITVDDVIDIIEAEVTEDIFRLSGVDEEEERYASPLDIVRSRTPWLLITLCTSGLGALVIARFESTIEQMAFVAVFMPVVAAMAGNSAVQATAVAVRRLALSSRELRPIRAIVRELAAGLVIGFVIATLIGVVAIAWKGDARIGLVIAGSMWGAISIGVFWGAAFPLLLDRLELDPAVSSSVFLSTMTDLVSFLLILGSASYFLSHLL